MEKENDHYIREGKGKHAPILPMYVIIACLSMNLIARPA
jgi:hypothetical protein